MSKYISEITFNSSVLILMYDKDQEVYDKE